MSNFISNKNLPFSTKNGRFPDNGIPGIGLSELRLMPNSSHLTCPQCGGTWFGLSKTPETTICGCGSCSWESVINFPLLSKEFSGECLKCKTPYFAIVKLNNKIVVGCKKCSWEDSQELEIKSPGGLILPN